MAKRKSSAIIHVADGRGGLRALEDYRFDSDDWPVRAQVSSVDASNWMAHFAAEVQHRGWSQSGMSQLEAAENSGTFTLRGADIPEPGIIHVVWSRIRNQDLSIRAKSPSGSQDGGDLAQTLLGAVATRLSEGRLDEGHRQSIFTYEGLPWRGELWLDDGTRLGPPSRFPDWLIGPQAVLVDCVTEGIGSGGINASFHTRLSEIQVLLALVLGKHLEVATMPYGWVPELSETGSATDCVLRPTGYVELARLAEFPVPGTVAQIPRRVVDRPGLGPLGIWADMDQVWVPDDIEEIWKRFRDLPSTRRAQLMRAGNAFRISLTLGKSQRTAAAMYRVIACEALKPEGKSYNKWTIYEVVTALLGAETSMILRGLRPNPLGVRSNHAHPATLATEELLPLFFGDAFEDPSFNEMSDVLYTTTRTCLIEFVRRGGAIG